MAQNGNGKEERYILLEKRLHSIEEGRRYYKNKWQELETGLGKSDIESTAVIVHYFGVLIGDILSSLEAGTTRQSLEGKCYLALTGFLGTPDQRGELTKLLNSRHGGIIDSLCRECRGIGALEQNLFTLTALRVPNRVIAFVLDMKNERAVMRARSTLIKKISFSPSENKSLYLQIMRVK